MTFFLIKTVFGQIYHLYNTLGNGSSQSLEEQPEHQGFVLCCDESPCFGHTGFILITPVSPPCLCSPPSPFSPSLSALSPWESNDFLHLLHLKDNKDWTIREVAFSLGIDVCAQPKIPLTIHSTEIRCFGPTEHHYHP